MFIIYTGFAIAMLLQPAQNPVVLSCLKVHRDEISLAGHEKDLVLGGLERQRKDPPCFMGKSTISTGSFSIANR